MITKICPHYGTNYFLIVVIHPGNSRGNFNRVPPGWDFSLSPNLPESIHLSTFLCHRFIKNIQMYPNYARKQDTGQGIRYKVERRTRYNRLIPGNVI